jgi:hypothetical protein
MIKFLIIFLLLVNTTAADQFHVRIKTKAKSIIGVPITATDPFNAEYKVKKKYPGCEILNVKKLK